MFKKPMQSVVDVSKQKSRTLTEEVRPRKQRDRLPLPYAGITQVRLQGSPLIIEQDPKGRPNERTLSLVAPLAI
jgi:hypothetical protein